MGNAVRKFLVNNAENSVFKFTIDTTLINPEGTDGSENPLTFRLPIAISGGNPANAILKVNDGRPDVVLNNSTPSENLTLNFASAGIYQITIIGMISFFMPSNSTVGYDRLKLKSIDHWGNRVGYQSGCFNGCSNLEFTATNTLKLPPNSNSFFANTKGFPNGSLSNIDFTEVTSANSILSGVTTIFTELFNPFMPSITSINGIYSGLNVEYVTKVEIISNSVTNASSPFGLPLRNFSGELILTTPNNTNVQALCYYFNVSPSLAKVDVRNVTTNLNFIRYPLSTAKMDATLIAWANLPFMQSGVTWDWKGSKYSNNPTVLAALNKITSDWGVIFTNLTME